MLPTKPSFYIFFLKTMTEKWIGQLTGLFRRKQLALSNGRAKIPCRTLAFHWQVVPRARRFGTLKYKVDQCQELIKRKKGNTIKFTAIRTNIKQYTCCSIMIFGAWATFWIKCRIDLVDTLNHTIWGKQMLSYHQRSSKRKIFTNGSGSPFEFRLQQSQR